MFKLTYSKATILNIFTVGILIMGIFLTTVVTSYPILHAIPFAIFIWECATLFKDNEISPHFLTANTIILLSPIVIEYVQRYLA